MVNEESKQQALLKPAPLIDIITFDVLSQNLEGKTSPAYDEMFKVIANFDFQQYNSIAIDPLVEFSQQNQTQSKLKSGGSAFDPIEVKWWGGAQERAAILLRRLRNYRDQGVFVYFTSSEFIDKDYGTDPRSANKGEKPEEPYCIKGTINVPGKLVREINHMVDIQCHARMMNGQPIWVTKEEPARGGSFNWEAKDRTGRIPEMYIQPNCRKIIEWVYGKEAWQAIKDFCLKEAQ
jgi:hypothetical protein